MVGKHAACMFGETLNTSLSYICVLMKAPKAIAENESEIISEFSSHSSWQDTYEHIIEIGKELPELNIKYKIDEYRIRGCQSDLWLVAFEKDGFIYFNADSNSLVVKGLVALLIKVLSGQKAGDILRAKLDFIETIGLKHHLSPSRSNGVAYMVSRMRSLAIRYLADRQ